MEENLLNIRNMIKKAISEKRLVKFVCEGLEIIGEPQVYGLKKGNAHLLVYQTGGQSNNRKPFPKWFDAATEDISDFVILDKQFRGRRRMVSLIFKNFNRVLVMVT